MKEIYFDNSATTATADEVALKMSEAISVTYGNPSSVHAAGIKAERLLSEAHRTLLSALGINDPHSGTLVFTGSGTEADNLALFGVVRAKNRRFVPEIITTDSEHHAISEPLKYLEGRNEVIVRRLSTVNGIISKEELLSYLNPHTVLVSVMTVNNETGAYYDPASIFSVVKEAFPDCVTHTDAVQAFMKLPILPKRQYTDLVSLSAHKINGPKGVGALYIDPALLRAKKLIPYIYGGGQEGGLRSGTENMPGIAGFAEAVRLHIKSGNRLDRIAALRNIITENLPEGVRVNTPAGRYLPHIISLTLPDIKGEVMVRFLSERGIYVSSGSACSSHDRRTSPALLAFGLDPHSADCTIRVSVSASNTDEEAARFTEALKDGVMTLARTG